MVQYEAIFIVSPDIIDEKIDDLINKISNLVKQLHCDIDNIQKLGKRKLAYLINNYHEGYYIQLKFRGSNTLVSLIEKFCKFNDFIIRYMVIKEQNKKSSKKISKINNNIEDIKK
ncbi:MAG: 30S ribosomal protein S6 [Endomicrobium sp.]|jgi:small subunit ribosomal protein S6|nr:30S ribosomal protein S6 [Endomicrobium sp.]